MARRVARAAVQSAASAAAPKPRAKVKAAAKRPAAKAARGKKPTSSAPNKAAPRCAGKCRLAWPCPTDNNKSGRGACGNAGCTNHGAVYGCRPCGIRLCSFECINAHMFEGRAIKPGLRPVEFHDWYQGE